VQLQFAQHQSSYAVTYIIYTVQCYTTQSRAQPCYLQYAIHKNPSIPCTSWDTGHQHPRQLKITPPTRKYMATTHPANIPHHYTQATHHPICFHTSQNGQDPLRLGAHTHQPIDHAHQEAKQDTTHQSTTDNQLDWLCTHSIITNCKTNECYGVQDLDIKLYLHIVLVYLL
jgi:hypothetical protein